jgi:hypothetical protein
LPELFNRLKALDRNSAGEGYGRTVEYLFRLGLALRPEELFDNVREAVRGIGRRARALKCIVGEWVRKESRRADWEMYSEKEGS